MRVLTLCPSAGGFEIERLRRKPFVSPLRAKGAQPARATSLRRGYLGTGEWAAPGILLCREGLE